MSEKGTQRNPELRWVRLFRISRPAGAVIMAMVLALAWACHLRYAPRTRLVFEIRLDGKTVKDESTYSARLSGISIKSGAVVPIGWRQFTVTVPDAGSYQSQHWIHYGTNSVGPIELTYRRAALEFQVDPPASRVIFEGPYANFSLTNTAGMTGSVPIGSYAGKAVFRYFTNKFVLTVSPGQTNSLRIQPPLGAIEVRSEPPNARFHLARTGAKGVEVQGETPFTANALPAGGYRLRLWRENYARETNFLLSQGTTNSIRMVFDYGSIQVVSTPSNAVVYLDGKAVGKTPATWCLVKPGHHGIRVEQTGYYPAEWSIKVEGNTVVSLTTNLISFRYSDALARAREQATAAMPDYTRGLEMAELALAERPGDADAYALKNQLEKRFNEEQQRLATQKQTEEAETRRRNPEKLFQRFAEGRRHANLFATQTMRFPVRLERMREAVRCVLAGRWEILLDTRSNDQAYLVEARIQSLARGKRNLALVAGQITDHEVEVLFKIWDYTLDPTIDPDPVRGITDDHYVPLHPDYLKNEEPQAIADRLQAAIQEFKTQLTKELP